MGRQGNLRKSLFYAGLGAVAITACSYFVFGRLSARITGGSREDRLASIHRIATEQPAGAGKSLADAALTEGDWQAREAALAGLAHVAQAAQAQHRAAIEQATRDPVPQVRAAAAAALGSFHDEGAADKLGEMAVGDPNASARIGAVIGLGRSRCLRATMLLLEAMERSTPEVQYRAVRELYRKLDMRYIGPPPDQEKNWPAQIAFLCEYVKRYPKVQEAYQAAGKPLVRRPELEIRHPTPEATAPPGTEQGAVGGGAGPANSGGRS
jgi:hypothetical protein